MHADVARIAERRGLARLHRERAGAAVDVDAAVAIAADLQAAQPGDGKVFGDHRHVAAVVGDVDLAATGEVFVIVVDVDVESVAGAVAAVARERRQGQRQDGRGDEKSSHVSSSVLVLL